MRCIVAKVAVDPTAVIVPFKSYIAGVISVISAPSEPVCVLYLNVIGS